MLMEGEVKLSGGEFWCGFLIDFIEIRLHSNGFKSYVKNNIYGEQSAKSPIPV